MRRAAARVLLSGTVLALTGAFVPRPFALGSGGGSIYGEVVSAGSGGTAVRLAGAAVIVRRVSMPGRVGRIGAPIPSSLAPGSELRALTDASGRFSVHDLPRGDYIVAAQADGSTTARGSEATAAGSSSALASVRENGAIPYVVLTVAARGTITGNIAGPDGMGSPGLRVAAGDIRYESGAARWQTLRHTVTDERGSYRIEGLAPGSYYVAASPTLLSEAPPAAADVFFPGTVDFNRARRIVLDEGAAADASFQMTAAPGGGITLSGSVAASEEAILEIAAAVPRVGIDGVWAWRVPLSASNSFTIANIPPGSYVLHASGRRNSRWWAGSLAVEAEGSDLQGLVVDLDGAYSDVPLSFNVEDGDVEFPTAPVLRSRDPARPLEVPGVPAGTAGFVFRNVPPGTYDVFASTLPDLAIKDVLQGRVSIFEDGLTLKEKPPEPLHVVLGSGGGAIEATLLPAAEAWMDVGVALVPDPPLRENHRLYREQALVLRNEIDVGWDEIPPGRYRIFAIRNMPAGAALNGGYLSRYEAYGVSVTVSEGWTTKVVLPVLSD